MRGVRLLTATLALLASSPIVPAFPPQFTQPVNRPAPASVPADLPGPAERHDVESSGEPGEHIVWRGRLDPAREVVAHLWNGTEWEEGARVRGDADRAVVAAAPVATRHRHDGVVPTLVTGEDPFADDLANPVRSSFEDPADYDFAIAHLTDTQYLTEGAVAAGSDRERQQWRDAYADIAHWVRAHHRQRKIAFVAHTGDVIENWHDPRTDAAYRATAERELDFASGVQDIIDASGVPNAVIPGNHDNVYGTDTGPGALFNTRFGPERYAALADRPGWQRAGAEHHPWRTGDNANSYTLFSAGGLDFVVVGLGFGVDAEEADWADRVLTRFSHRNAIVLTHAYGTPAVNRDGRGGGFADDGRLVLEQVVAPHPNVALVLSGHEHGVSIQTRRDVGTPGNHVVELLADYQFYTVGPDAKRLGSSFFRLLQIDVDRGEMAVDTYSPLLDNFGATEFDDRDRYDGTEDDTRLPLQLLTRTTTFDTAAVHSSTTVRSTPLPTPEVAAAPPVNVAAPHIDGRAWVGKGLRLDLGEWQHDETARFTVQWLRDGTPIRDATGGDFRLTEADDGTQISVRVTVTSPGHAPVTVTTPSLDVRRAIAGPITPDLAKTALGRATTTLTRGIANQQGVLVSHRTVTGWLR